MTSAGGLASRARASSPRRPRPYGIWLDLLRAIARTRPRARYGDLGMLLPEAGPAAEPGTGAGCSMPSSNCCETHLGTSRRDHPRRHPVDRRGFLLASPLCRAPCRYHLGPACLCAGRDGEIEDNAAASSVLRSLAREKRLAKIELVRSSPDEPALVRPIDPALDGARIFAESDGNPLFTLELARAYQRGDADPGPTIEAVIGGQLARAHGSGARRASVGRGPWPRVHARRSRACRPSRLTRNCSRHSASWSGADWCGLPATTHTTSATIWSGRPPIAPSRSRGASCCIGMSRAP